MNTRSLPSGSRIDKLVNRGKSDVFMGYDENTTIQYRIWTSNRSKIIKHHKVTFSKHEKWGSESLNLKVATFNVLLERRSIDRPRKATIVAFEVVQPALAIVEPATSTSIDTSNWQAPIVKKSNLVNDSKEQYIDDTNDPSKVNEMTIESTVQTRAKLAALTTSPKMTKQFLHVVISKRKRDDATNEKERDEHRDKIARAMLALLTQDLNKTNNEE